MDDPIHLNIDKELGDSIREMQIEQTLAGLRLMPHMQTHVQRMADDGDDVMKEVLKRFKP